MGDHMGLGRVTATAACAVILAACSSTSADPASSIGSPSSPSAAVASPSEAAATPVAEVPTDPPGFAIQTQSRTDLQNYDQFTYMTATVTGLAPEAAAKADERIKGMVDAVVSAAVADDDGECIEGEPKCRYFEQSLVPISCTDGHLCLEQRVSAVPIGSATGYESVEVLVLDPESGRTQDLGSVVPSEARDAFLTAMNSALVELQKREGYHDPEVWGELAATDIGAWAPVSEGIRVWFPKYTAGPGALGVVDVMVPYPGSDSSIAGSVPEPRWRAIKDASSDPLYVILKSYSEESDGSILLTVDPLSPDTKGTAGPSCESVTFSRPDASYCLINTTKRDRRVTLLPGADVGVGDSTVTFAQLVDYVNSTPSIVFLGLDGQGFANMIVAYASTPNQGGWSDGEGSETTQQQLTTVPNVIGVHNSDASRLLQQSGLVMSRRFTNGDPSMAAQTNNGCTVVDQQPRGGSQVPVNTSITILVDCPMTNQGGAVGGYTGPPPPPAWTGR